MKGKRILIGISGGIAAYKSAYLIRLFKKAGAEVKVVVTQNALEFITKVTLESLSQNKVYSSVFGSESDYSTEHISLTDWADVFVVAPATANIIGKFANGIADDALSTTFMAFNRKVFVAPAMNCKMYENFAFKNNIKTLLAQNVSIIEPEEGFLACGYEGKGRMEEPDVIFNAVKSYFKSSEALSNYNVLITAGPTYEAIDPVRFIGNHSSGLMGIEIAKALAEKGASVNLVCGPCSISVSHPNIQRIDVVSAEEMFKSCVSLFPKMNIGILAAAVADYTVINPKSSKIKKTQDNKELVLKLSPTKDILAHLGSIKKKGQILAGFALETDNEESNAVKKLKTKNLDFIVLNSLNDEGAGFKSATNKVSILDNKSNIHRYSLKSKSEVASDIVSFILDNFTQKDKKSK
ncbi:MAG: bifunctional phosphopantothenoylcysteine decarboxylase/phosphopantothenate--cysteine ligase CoaBC [Bacteroidetes bacterium]|nr:bifunctional phosphopantothenoylcysteine decarboxylase/phosphopantothenate--cysteine ligase CoaBC [Bacteroidota bacterium]